MRRGAQGALWSLPLVYAISQGIGGDIRLALVSAGLFAALGLVPVAWLRIALRATLYLGAIYLRLLGPRSLWHLPEQTLSVLRHGHLTALTAPESMLIFLLLVPALIAIFERTGGGSQLRLWQALGGAALLAVLQSLDVAVGGELLCFAALYFPVRYFDLAGDRPAGRPSAFAAAVVFAAAAVALLYLNPVIAPGIAYGKGGIATEGYLANPQNVDVGVQTSQAREFFAAVQQPLYWMTYIGQTYTGQGWKVAGRWRRMQPLELTGQVQQGERVLKERITLYAKLPTDPVDGAVVTVLSPAKVWRYRGGSESYSVPGSKIEVLAVQSGSSGGLTGPLVQPVSAGDLAVPAPLLTGPTPLAARQAIAGAGPGELAKAQAIVAYLQANERYTLKVPPDHGRDFVTNFLFVSHAGDCNGFSSAFAILAREDGIPTRWVTGFLPGTRVKGGYLVRANDAHSWDEIYISGTGWVAIDPTPGFAVPQPAPKTAPAASTSVAKALRQARAAQLRAASGLGHGPLAHQKARGVSPWPYALALLVAAAIVCAVLVRRRLPLWWLRTVARIFRDPWPRDVTVRAWLDGRAPALQAFLEWRIYRPAPDGPVSLQAARSDLSALYLGAHRPRRGRTLPARDPRRNYG